MYSYIVILYILNNSLFAQTNEQLQQQIIELQKRMKVMEKKKSNKLKIKDFSGNAAGSTPASETQIPKKQMESFMKTLKKGNKHIEARDELLKDLEDEGL